MSKAAVVLVLCAAACDAPSSPADAVPGSPALERGPKHAVRNDRICTFTYDDADRLVSLVQWYLAADIGVTYTYTWDGDQLAEIETSGWRWVNEAAGSRLIRSDDGPEVVHTYDARFELPLVLTCDDLSSSVADHAVSTTLFWDGVEVERDDYEYFGVTAGEEGQRTRITVHTPPWGDVQPQSGWVSQADFTYDARGLLVSADYQVEDEPFVSVDYAYREDRRPSSRISVADWPWAWTFTYDAGGNLLTIDEDYDGERKTETYEY